MGRDLAAAFPAARHLFDEVDDALSQPLSRLMFEGPESELTLTENAQPALMAASFAVIRVLEAEGGFDIGTACRFCRRAIPSASIRLWRRRERCTVGDAARLLKLRGQAMQRAVPVGQGAMAALIGLDAEAARMVAAKATRAGLDHDEICAVANDNAPGQAVVSGHRQRGRAGNRDRPRAWRPPFGDAAGQRAVSFAVAGARRRCDGCGAGQGCAAPAAGAAGRQCHRMPGQGPRRDQALIGPAGNRNGALARERPVSCRIRGRGIVEIGAGRVLPGSSSALPRISPRVALGRPPKSPR